MNLTVYIPTRGRIGHESQITLRELEKFSSFTPVIVCPVNEVDRHKYAKRILACPYDGIGPTRQFILETHYGQHSSDGHQGVVMLDDDMYFSRRKDPSVPVPLERCDDLNPMFQWISDQLDAGFVHGGISARQGNNHIPRPWVDCIRVNNAHFFNAAVYMNERLRFDVIPVMEDFYVSLTLLLRGYPNRVAYHYCWSQRGSGTKGGCSLYRTSELQAQAARELHRLFPDYVKVVTKESISGGKLFSGERTDVNIGWLKAWADRKYERQPEPDLRRR